MISTSTWHLPMHKSAVHGNTDTRAGNDRANASPDGFALSSEPLHRTVIFATRTAAIDIPVPRDFPAALLPLGPEIFIERVLEELSDLGLRDIDVVVSDQPEALRQVLGEGERWGMALRWHLVKAADTPYALLRRIAYGTQRVLIGHADHWVSAATLQHMQTRNTVVVDESCTQWCGWASLSAQALADVHHETDMVRLYGLICASQGIERLQAGQQDHAFGATAAQLLAVQQPALNLDASSIPAAWIRTPWGAMSPDASVSLDAVLTGPVLAGPGSFVHAGAQVGPNVVLSGDVIVASGASISNSLVMSGTFLGNSVGLHGAVARGNLIQKVGTGERISIAESEGTMLLHSEIQPLGVAVASRALAAMVLMVLLPWYLLDLVFRGLTGTPKRWVPYPAVIARHNNPAQLLSVELRVAPAARTAYGAVAWYFGGVLDVLQGRRCWFGIRPRRAAQFNALSTDWQRIFTGSLIGLFHAPAWTEPDSASDSFAQLESLAVADAYLSVPRSAWQRWALCWAIFSGSASPKPAVSAQTHAKDLS